jgi:hypothetical protein
MDHIIVTEFGVEAATRDPGSSFQFAGRGRHGSTSQFCTGRRPVAEQVGDGASPKTRWVAAPGIRGSSPTQMGCRSIRCFRSSLDSLFPQELKNQDADEEDYRRTWTPRRLARPSLPPSTVKLPAAELTRRSYCVTPATSCASPVTRRRSPIAAKHGVVDRATGDLVGGCLPSLKA